MSTPTNYAVAPSVDEREVAFYDSLAATWWDTSGPFWPLHRLNGLRAGWITSRVIEHFGLSAGSDAPLAGLRVLDVGCGGGILTESIAQQGATVVGIDVVKKNIAVARSHARKGACDVEYHCTTAEALAASGASFDVVLNMEVVEHVADLDGFLGACSGMVRDGGMMVVATLNRTPKSWLFGIVGAEYVMRWLPRGTHRWDWFRKPQEIESLLARDGLAFAGATGVNVSPLTRRFSLCDSLSVNYMLWATKNAQRRDADTGNG